MSCTHPEKYTGQRERERKKRLVRIKCTIIDGSKFEGWGDWDGVDGVGVGDAKPL
jgi:hypothetical protein